MDYISRLTMLLFLSSVASQTTDSEDSCKGKESCVIIKDCAYAMKLVRNVSAPGARQKLQNMVCGFFEQYPKVCCPQNETQNLSNSIVYQTKPEKAATSRPKPDGFVGTNALALALGELPTLITRVPGPITTTEMPKELTPAVPSDPFPDRNICGQYVVSDRIVGGEIAAVDEFPWLAVVNYRDDDNNVTSRCTASLITNRHLLSAAHCFVNLSKLKPFSIRLGVWNVESTSDCFEGVCPAPPVEIEIGSVLTHPTFDTIKGDIAIITLKQPVNFTDFIQPVCLPTTEYVKMHDYLRESTYWVAGWGETEFGEQSAIKRKVDVDAVPIDICLSVLTRIPKSASEVLICAGGQAGKDSCRGDSGGPLMREVQENYNSNWFLYGITSFGVRRCGQAGIPGVYTRVTAYMDWIRENVQT